MNAYISVAELEELIKFASGETGNIDATLLEKFDQLHASVTRSVLKSYTGLRKRNALLEERIDKYRDREQQRVAQLGFDETGLDSYEVAQALLYQLQHLDTYKLTKQKVVLILYEMYASWLVSKKERLVIEHPVATEWGPQFWRVYKRINVGMTVEPSAWKRLAEMNPGVAAFCKNAAQKYCDYKDSELRNAFVKSAAYRKASKDNNGGKWNGEIRDEDIAAWKAKAAKL